MQKRMRNCKRRDFFATTIVYFNDITYRCDLELQTENKA